MDRDELEKEEELELLLREVRDRLESMESNIDHLLSELINILEEG